MGSLRFAPLVPERWADLERLFGPRGAYSGCWCAYYRVPRAEFDRIGSAGRKRVLRKAVDVGPPPGLLAYAGDDPIAWVAIAPREATPVLERSRVSRSPDGRPAWAITCFFVTPARRGQGLMDELIRGAEAYARREGAELVEAWPTKPREALEGCTGYTGVSTSFVRCGWDAVSEPTPGRVHVRKAL